MATAALVLGIISIVLFWAPWLSLTVAILGIIFGSIAKSRYDEGLPGLICSIVGFLLSIIWIIIILTILKAIFSAFLFL